MPTRTDGLDAKLALCLPFLLGAAKLSTAVAAEGVYEPVPLKESERQIIESANELEGYFRNQSLIYTDEAIVSFVRRVGHSLAPAPTDDYIHYEFFVLRDPSPNAFSLPNGHVYVHTGMLARLDDEAQLAALLAHEINHVAGHHGIIENRTSKSRTIAGMVLGGLSGWGGLISMGLYASIYGFSRDLEQEADDRAANLLLNSEYDPHALPELFDILGQDYEGLYPRVQTIWSTHPEIEARAITSRALVADLPRRNREVETFELSDFPLRLLTVRDYIQDDYPHTAVALAEKLVERYPGEPSVLILLGDAWQAMGAQSVTDPESLSNADKRRNLGDRARWTREQREAELLETPEGRAAFAANLAEAERVYRQVLDLDPGYAPAYRGLGEVNEHLDRPREAAAAYLKYVQLEPDSADRGVIVGRMRQLAARIRTEESSNADH